MTALRYNRQAVEVVDKPIEIRQHVLHQKDRLAQDESHFRRDPLHTHQEGVVAFAIVPPVVHGTVSGERSVDDSTAGISPTAKPRTDSVIITEARAAGAHRSYTKTDLFRRQRDIAHRSHRAQAFVEEGSHI